MMTCVLAAICHVMWDRFVKQTLALLVDPQSSVVALRPVTAANQSMPLYGSRYMA